LPQAGWAVAASGLLGEHQQRRVDLVTLVQPMACAAAVSTPRQPACCHPLGQSNGHLDNSFGINGLVLVTCPVGLFRGDTKTRTTIGRLFNSLVASGILTGSAALLRPRRLGSQSRSRKEAMMKVRSSLRSLKRKPGSVVVRRRGQVRVVNRTNRRWNSRQG